MLIGESVYLIPLDRENAETFRGWVNDPEVHRWMLSGQLPVSRADQEHFLDATQAEAEARTAFRFEIHRRSDDRLVGACSLEHVDLVHRHGEIGLLVGEKDEWGKGYGGDAARCLLAFGFDTLGLHRIWISVFAEHARALELYRRLGFTEVGREREGWFIRGAFRDLIRLDMLEEEWRARRA